MEDMRAVFVLFLSLSAFAESTSLNSKKGIFIDGYDPVSYLVEGQAVKGQKKWTHKYKSSDVLFSTEENLKKFTANPEKFLPVYNGWCAYAMAKSAKLVKVNPKRFKVINGKTYLFFDDNVLLRGRINTLEKWNQSSDEFQIKKANANWLKSYVE